METFQDYAYYYNAFYKDKDYRGESEVIDQLLKKYGERKIGNIVNFGCGTGRHDIELTKMGYCCKGIDMSPLMIDIAKQNSVQCCEQIDFEVADVRCFVPARQYDAVISLFHVMSYQNSNEDILNAFKAARNCLKKDGLFLFDVWYGPGVLSDKPCVRVKEVEDSENKLIRIARPRMHDKDNVVDVKYEVMVISKQTGVTRTIRETHKMRYFFMPELRQFLFMTGFDIVNMLDCQTLLDTSFDTWTSYIVAKAI